jgi:serine/threonine protein kinase
VCTHASFACRLPPMAMAVQRNDRLRKLRVRIPEARTVHPHAATLYTGVHADVLLYPGTWHGASSWCVKVARSGPDACRRLEHERQVYRVLLNASSKDLVIRYEGHHLCVRPGDHIMLPLARRTVNHIAALVTPYTPWGCLESFASCHSLGIHEVRSLITDTILGIACMHLAGVAHGNLSPPNILIVPTPPAAIPSLKRPMQFTAKLTDMGHAVERPIPNGQALSAHTCTWTHTTTNTPLLTEDCIACRLAAYEAVKAGDVWAIGRILVDLMNTISESPAPPDRIHDWPVMEGPLDTRAGCTYGPGRCGETTIPYVPPMDDRCGGPHVQDHHTGGSGWTHDASLEILIQCLANREGSFSAQDALQSDWIVDGFGTRAIHG